MSSVDYDNNGFAPVSRPDSKTRIIYVDPNDIYGNINNVPLTPDYTDYCIWCNLVVEKSSRIKTGVEGSYKNGSNEMFSISWDATASEGTNYISFMQGKDALRYNFLTTDYADIDFNTIKQRNMIEGLGIESINISMNNYYVPEVTINFVDVRGSGFFGREEATHDTFDLINLEKDVNGNSYDNLYNCFVSFPYPRIRLQIKGFYGKPVTYQLTCSGFTGDFDSSNGNFKMTAKFIGYQYSILADIPFKYIVAAPYCQYEGTSYWDKHVNSKIWELSGGAKPVKLGDFFEKIRSSITRDDAKEALLSYSETVSINNLTKARGELNAVINAFNSFVDSLANLFNGNGNNGFYVNSFTKNDNAIDVANQQIIFFSKNPVVTLTEEVCKKYNKFVLILDAYTGVYQGEPHNDNNECFDKSRRPNIGEDKWEPGDIQLTKLLEIKSNLPYIIETGKCVTSNNFSSYGASVSQIASGGSSGTLKICQELSNKLKTFLTQDSKVVKSNSVYACILDCKRITPLYNELNKLLAERIAIVTQQMEKNQELNIVKYFGFAPYVGNLYKIIMCHLETFIHIMYRVAENIDIAIPNNGRKPSGLGVDLNNTDANSISYVPAWPAIYKPEISLDEDTKYQNLDNTLERGWVGDVRGSLEWEEKKMIDNLYYGFIYISYDIHKEETSSITYPRPSILTSSCPIIPSDLIIKTPKYAYENKDKLAAYLGIRMMQIFPLFNRGNNVDTTIAEKLGKLDAYNFFKNRPYHTMNQEMFRQEDGVNRIDSFIDIMTCKDNGSNSPYIFEFTNTEDKRQPIFVNENGKLKYTYMTSYGNDSIPILPTTVSDLSQNSIKEYFSWNGDEKTHRFSCRYNDEEDNGYVRIANDTQYVGNSVSYINSSLNTYDEDDKLVIQKKYINHSMFCVIDDNSNIESIDNIYKMLNGENVSGGRNFSILTENSQNYTDISKKYWENIDKEESEFYDINASGDNSIQTIKYNKYCELTGKDTKEDFEEILYNLPNLKMDFDGNYDNVSRTKAEIRYQVKLNSDVKVNKHYFLNYVFSNGRLKNETIFGSAFYYLQNGKKYIHTSTDPLQIDDKNKKVKILLFLHTFIYKYDILKNNSFFNSNNKKNGGIEKLPYMYLLFIGGLIWRKRYVEENGKDPIEYGDVFKQPASNIDPLLYKVDGEYRFVYSAETNPYNVKYSDIINTNMDIVIENELKDRFENYTNIMYGDIEDSMELHCSDKENGVNRLLFYQDIYNILQFMFRNVNDIKTINSVLCYGETNDDIQICFNDFKGKYSILLFTGKGIKYSFSPNRITNEEDKFFENIIKEKCYVLTTINSNSNAKVSNTIQLNVAHDYLNGFMNTIDLLLEKAEEEELAFGSGVDDKAKQERDFKVGMYMYLKNLWDKWLSGYYYSDTHITNDAGSPLIKETFNVENYFTNFLFMDSFYRNIFKKLKLNCEKLLKAYAGGTENYNIYSYLGTVASDHQCMFLSLPDYVNLGDNDKTVAVQNMSDMFRPMPANRVPLPQRENKFIVMYTHQPSSITTVDKSHYKPDSFDIWSEQDGTNIASTMFYDSNDNVSSNLTGNELILDNQINRYGYNVPSFGVAYSRQNNSIFKNISASMSNPVMTEQAILAMGNIAEMGNSTGKKVVYYGQDIYPIYSNYSYTIEIDMMGDAQIQPLMYFQLMNIPMFRGTYMIISVTHSISQGNMNTHIKATKMSKYATPFVSNWFTIPPENKDKENNGYNNGISNDMQCDIHYRMADYLKQSVNRDINGNPKDATSYTSDCAAYVNKAIIEGGGIQGYDKGDAKRGIEKNLMAVGFIYVDDIKIDKDHKDTWEIELGKCLVGDVAVFQPFSGHEYGHTQMCVESNGGKTKWCSDAEQSKFWCNDKFRVSVLSDNSYVKIYRYTNADKCNRTLGFSGNNSSIPKVELTKKQKEDNAKWLMNYFTGKLKDSNIKGVDNNLHPYQAAALVGNIWYESCGCNPYQIEIGKNKPGRGLCQWTINDRKALKGYDLASKYNNNIENMMTSQDMNVALESQARYCAWELKNSYKNKLFGRDNKFGTIKTGNDSIDVNTLNENTLNEGALRYLTSVILDEYEVPGVSIEYKQHHNQDYKSEYESVLNNRYKKAEIAYKLYKGIPV